MDAVEEGRAAIWEINLAPGRRRQVAAGMRKPHGMAWNPSTGERWATQFIAWAGGLACRLGMFGVLDVRVPAGAGDPVDEPEVDGEGDHVEENPAAP